MTITPIPGCFNHGNFICASGHAIQKDQYKEGLLAWLAHLFLRNTVWVTVKEGSRCHTLYVSLKVVREHVEAGQFKTTHGIGAIFARTLKTETPEHKQQRKDLLLRAIATNSETNIRGDFEHDTQVIQAQANARFNRATALWEENPRESIVLLRLAIAQGSVQAQWTLGMLLYQGNRVPRDLSQARQLLHQVAVQGNCRAQYYFAWMCEKGEGGAQDLSEAFRFYQLSAKQNFCPSQYCLGEMYERGIAGVVGQNRDEALRLYKLAADQGLDQARCASNRLSDSPVP
jgi:hypothetical protein